jgi:dTDP-4-dehydrorhamnose reductase
MKVLVTGANGQLGYDIVNELTGRGNETFGFDINEMDITDVNQVEKVFRSRKPVAVIHCAAYTAVDAAESHVELCRKVNINGTENVAKACSAIGANMIYISTDYVFDGSGSRPRNPDDIDITPLNVYGQSKYEGEIAVRKHLDKYFIVRISWAFGTKGNNFVKTMLRVGSEKGAVSVVDDQIGSPTYTYDLAVLLADMISTDKYGIYHATNEGFCSWYEFACEIFRVAKMNVTVTPITSDQYPTQAKRPYNSRMSKDKLDEYGFKRLPTWQDALERYIIETMNPKSMVIIKS